MPSPSSPPGGERRLQRVSSISSKVKVPCCLLESRCGADTLVNPRHRLPAGGADISADPTGLWFRHCVPQSYRQMLGAAVALMIFQTPAFRGTGEQQLLRLGGILEDSLKPVRNQSSDRLGNVDA